MLMMHYSKQQQIDLVAGGRNRGRSLAKKRMKDERGFLQDVGKFIDIFQELILKADILIKKLDEAIDLIKPKDGSDS